MALSFVLTLSAGALIAAAGGRLAHLLPATMLLVPAAVVAALTGGQAPVSALLQAALLSAALQAGYVAGLVSLTGLAARSRPRVRENSERPRSR